MVFISKNNSIYGKIIYYYRYIYKYQGTDTLLRKEKYAWKKRKMRQLWKANAQAVYAKKHSYRVKGHGSNRMVLRTL